MLTALVFFTTYEPIKTLIYSGLVNMLLRRMPFTRMQKALK